MATYLVQYANCEPLYMRANFADAASNISYEDDDGRWIGTQYQVADSRHDPNRAGVLLVSSLGRDWWLDPDDDEPEDELEYIDENISVEPYEPDSGDISRWTPVASYVSEFTNSDDPLGIDAVDVDVEIAGAHGVWLVHTDDHVGNVEDIGAYDDEDVAISRAMKYADEEGNADEDESAEEYIARLREERATEDEDPSGEWCVYWQTSGDDDHVVQRYASPEGAACAAALKNAGLKAQHPGHLLCGYEVRSLVDGEWVESDHE